MRCFRKDNWISVTREKVRGHKIHIFKSFQLLVKEMSHLLRFIQVHFYSLQLLGGVFVNESSNQDENIHISGHKHWYKLKIQRGKIFYRKCSLVNNCYVYYKASRISALICRMEAQQLNSPQSLSYKNESPNIWVKLSSSTSVTWNMVPNDP